MIPGLGWRRINTGIILSILGIKMNDTRVRMEKEEYWNNLVYSRNKDECYPG